MSTATFLRVVPALAPLSEKESLEQRREELRAELAAVESRIALRSSLTGRQTELIKFLSNYQILNEGRSPTWKEIGNALGLRSDNAVRKHLLALEKKGAISREAGRHRSIRLLRSL